MDNKSVYRRTLAYRISKIEMVDQLKSTDKYFAIVYWSKGGSKKDKELLDYFATEKEASDEVDRQKNLDRHSETKYEYEILEKTGKQIKEMW